MINFKSIACLIVVLFIYLIYPKESLAAASWTGHVYYTNANGEQIAMDGVNVVGDNKICPEDRDCYYEYYQSSLSGGTAYDADGNPYQLNPGIYHIDFLCNQVARVHPENPSAEYLTQRGLPATGRFVAWLRVCNEETGSCFYERVEPPYLEKPGPNNWRQSYVGNFEWIPDAPPTPSPTGGPISFGAGFRNPIYGGFMSQNVYENTSGDPNDARYGIFMNDSMVYLSGAGRTWPGSTIRLFVSKADGTDSNDFICPNPKFQLTVADGSTKTVCKVDEDLTLANPRLPDRFSTASMQWNPPFQSAETYYMWVDVRDRDNNWCSGAKKYFTELNLDNPVNIQGTNFWWCGNGSDFTVTTAKNDGIVAKECDSCTSPGVVGGSYQLSTLGFYNPLEARVKIQRDSGEYFYEGNYIDFSGIAFVAPGTTVDSFYQLEQAVSNGNGLIFLYANKNAAIRVTIGGVAMNRDFVAGQSYVYYNPSAWSEANIWNDVPGAPDKRELFNNSGRVASVVKLGDSRSLPFDPAWGITFEPGFGKKTWNTYQFVRTDSGFTLSNLANPSR